MLTDLQSEAARLLASNRSRSNYFAGGAVLNMGSWRLSDDLDIFTDTDEEIPDSVERDIRTLKAAGFEVVIDLEIYGCTEVTIRKGGRETIIQWMSETKDRFFPLERDEEWGLRLHMADLAVNKVLAASTRRKSRRPGGSCADLRGLLPPRAALPGGLCEDRKLFAGCASGAQPTESDVNAG